MFFHCGWRRRLGLMSWWETEYVGIPKQKLDELYGIWLDLCRHDNLDCVLCRRPVSPHQPPVCARTGIFFVSVYSDGKVVVSYTAIIMLAYNRWTNDTLEKSAIIDFTVAKIIFCVCIFISFALLAVDWFFAIKVIKSDGVAEAYMNPIAVSYNCIRGGHGKEDTGWRRFLVFAKLTEARGILDYLALFTYFSFKGEDESGRGLDAGLELMVR
jgi:hypothetical protein